MNSNRVSIRKLSIKIFLLIVIILCPSFAAIQEQIEGVVGEGLPATFYADELGIRKPLVRIGLLGNDSETSISSREPSLSGNDSRITVSSREPYRILETSTGQNVWKESYSGEVVFLPYGVSEASSYIYRVQIGSFESKEPAEALESKVERETGYPAIVSYSPDRRIYRVRVGEEKTPEATRTIASRLKELGYSEVWISEELPERKENLFIRVVDKDFFSEVSKTDSLVILPANPSATLTINGKEYRGYFEIRALSTGVQRAINILNIEDYLKGVVPLELGPEVWPEIEALKAQAVAARTYIYKNLGQFAEEGFDICDTQRCQVYGGKEAEHPMSNRAVDETYGQIAIYQGAPINALYTSTCGGMTEDAFSIFEAEKGEYLKAVECYPDRQALISKTYTVVSSEEIPLTEMGGDPELLRSFALLMVHGIFDEAFLKEEWEPKRRLRSSDILGSLLKVAGLSGISYEGSLTSSVDSIQEFWQVAARVFSLNQRADLQISEKDTALLLQMQEAEGLRKEHSKLMAYLIREGITPAELSLTTAPSDKLTQDYFIISLSNLLKRFGGLKLKEGSFREFGESAISLVSENESGRFPLSRKIVLFNCFGGSVFPAEEMKFIPGDKFFHHRDGEGMIDYLEKKPPVKGASDDRYSVNYSWEVTKSREELEKSINQKVPVGDLADLQEVRRGRSGRVIEMRFIGSAGEFTVKGLNIRNALQLKENLFTMDKKRGAEGALLSVTFSGKGWGHGVGLCQVGAYGMALRGKKYDEILKWYYSGIDLLKAYD